MPPRNNPYRFWLTTNDYRPNRIYIDEMAERRRARLYEELRQIEFTFTIENEFFKALSDVDKVEPYKDVDLDEFEKILNGG